MSGAWIMPGSWVMPGAPDPALYGGALVSTGVWKPDKRAADGPAALKGPVKYKR